MKVEILSSGDNYIYFVDCGGQAVVVDPTKAAPALASATQSGLHISHVLVTHHHFDHIGGCSEIKHASHCELVSPKASIIPMQDIGVADGDVISAGDVKFEVLELPGHTDDHVAYYARENNVLFTGDVLFAAGCGRIFEGTAEQMWNSLQRIMTLPDETRIYCGHEYALENLEFALHLEPENQDIEERLAVVREESELGVPSVPSTIGIEKKTNPFLRAADVHEFAEIRNRKNIW